MDEARKDSRVDLSMGAWGSFDTTVIGPCFGNVRNQHGQHGGNLLHTSRKLMMEWKVPLPPPTMTTPAFPDAKPASGFTGTLGWRDIFAFATRSPSAVTKIFPSEILVLKECMGAGAGASSISPVQTLKHATNGRFEWFGLEAR